MRCPYLAQRRMMLSRWKLGDDCSSSPAFSFGSAGVGNANEATTRVGYKALLFPAGTNPWANVRVARCCGSAGPVGDRLRRLLVIHAAQARERRLLASAALGR